MSTTLTRMDGAVWMLVRSHTKLRGYLLVKDISHRQLADALGWKSHSYIGRLVRGQIKTLDPDAALKIAKILEVPVDELFIIKVSSESGRNGQDAAA